MFLLNWLNRRSIANKKPNAELPDSNPLLSEQHRRALIEAANKAQNIGTVQDIDEMEERKNDLDFQLALCNEMISEGEILPYPFERAAILLSKKKRHREELRLCRYVESWCAQAEKDYDGRSAKHWLSPRLHRCIARIPKIEARIARIPGEARD